MTRKKTGPKATSRKQRAHSPNRRNALKGIAAYIGDKAVGGVIGDAAKAAAGAAAGAVLGRLTAPTPSGVVPPSRVSTRVLTNLTLEPSYLKGQDPVLVPEGESRSV